MESEEITSSRLADLLEVQRSGLSHILSGRNNPGFDFINKLLITFPELNSQWLITGKGQMYNDSQPTLFSQDKEITKVPPPSQPPENRIKESSPTIVPKKRVLKRVLLFFSDGSFEEYENNDL